MRVGKINYLFCSDEYVYDANVKFLNHDTYTDIITFDTVEGDSVSGDIMISIDRVGENAKNFGCTFEHELHRVIIHGVLHLLGGKQFAVGFEEELHRVVIHGVLHLLGFKDKLDADAALMRQKENESLELLRTMNC